MAGSSTYGEKSWGQPLPPKQLKLLVSKIFAPWGRGVNIYSGTFDKIEKFEFVFGPTPLLVNNFNKINNKNLLDENFVFIFWKITMDNAYEVSINPIYTKWNIKKNFKLAWGELMGPGIRRRKNVRNGGFGVAEPLHIFDPGERN